MFEYTKTEMISDLVYTAGYGISWAYEGKLDEEAESYWLYLNEEAEAELGKSEVTLTFAEIEKAMAKIAEGSVVNEKIAKICREALADPEHSDIDSEVADCVIQVATFGDVVFG